MTIRLVHAQEHSVSRFALSLTANINLLGKIKSRCPQNFPLHFPEHDQPNELPAKLPAKGWVWAIDAICGLSYFPKEFLESVQLNRV